MAAVLNPNAGSKRRLAPTTPGILRLLTASLLVTTAALLVATSALAIAVRNQVRTIGEQSAPQAATAADLYFSLSDMDFQVARLVLSAGSDDLAAVQIDALGSYRARSHQVDADLQQALTTTTSDRDRATTLDLLDALALYRQRAWQALTAGDTGSGHYTQAANLLHLQLLPGARDLRASSEARLEQAYRSKRATEQAALALVGGLGVLLVAQLVFVQVWMARSFRRTVNPGLLAATALTVLLVAPFLVLITAESRSMAATRTADLAPFLALSQARALSYDAATDTSRYLISDQLAFYDGEFQRKSQCLRGGGCDQSIDRVSALSGPSADRWSAFDRDHHRIVELAQAGHRPEAVAVLTGIRRGDASFDFSYFDAVVDEAARTHRSAFENGFGRAGRLSGWMLVPGVALLAVLVLVPLAVRPRLAEYR